MTSVHEWLDKSVFGFGEGEIWRLRDAMGGTAVFGGRGSGKTSGSGLAIARGFLKLGLGGLVLTVKAEDLATWANEYLPETGRPFREDFIVLQPQRAHPLAVWPRGLDTQPFRPFNLLGYEYSNGGRIAENAATLIMEGLSAGGGEFTQEPYWPRAAKQLVLNAVHLAAAGTAATEGEPELRFQDLLDIIDTAPQSLADLETPRHRGGRCYELLQRVNETRDLFELPEYLDLKRTTTFWTQHFPALHERTRNIIVSVFTSMAEGMLRSPLRELFCGDTCPEASPGVTFNADPSTGRPKVAVLNLPVNLYNDAGRFAQVLYKTIWQRAAQRRIQSLTDDADGWRPAFLWADEGQHFVTEEDLGFEQTARSALVATVMLTQSLPNITAAVGETQGKCLAGLLQTKVFHSNSDVETNQFGEQLFGKRKAGRVTAPLSLDGTWSRSTEEVPLVPAGLFTALKTGGPSPDPRFDRRVGAYVFQAGRQWRVKHRDRHYHEFEQRKSG
jgi:hypothetical protein